MPMFMVHSAVMGRLPRTVLLASSLAAILAACQPDVETVSPDARPVRTVTVEKRQVGSPAVFTGRIEAVDEVSLGFRIAGRILENNLKLGAPVEPGQMLARLEPQNEMNALRSAKANLAAARGELARARNHFERQEFLLARDVVSPATFDDAQQQLQTAQSQVDAAAARLEAAHDLVSFTELEADAPGTVTATGPGVGEVVQAGQMIVKLARRDGRDAIFDVPAQLIRTTPATPEITVSLASDPAVTAVGRVREVAPQANPVTRTFAVKVGLTDPPAAMRLGATVTGRMQTEGAAVIEIPASALIKSGGQSAVWIVDPSSLTVSMRKIEVQRDDPAALAVAGGLDAGDIVVTAGVRSLHPGQTIRLSGSQPPVK